MVAVIIDMHPPTSTAAALFAVNTAVHGVQRSSRSLGVLWNLDLTFMRPKFVFARLYAASREEVEVEVAIAERRLKQSGYVASSERDTCSSPLPLSPSRLQYACVWGVRLNTFETSRIPP